MKEIIQLYSDQHARALACVSEIRVHMKDPVSTEANAHDLRMILARLAGVLVAHLKSEDQFLYPALIASSNSQTSTTAKKFFDEMGVITPLVLDFMDKWRPIGEIEKDPKGFIAACHPILEALGRRIEAEEKHLYPLCNDD